MEQATLEFSEHGFGDLVTVKQRDACTTGFDLSLIADAVFLDLPRPWEALESAKAAIKKQGWYHIFLIVSFQRFSYPFV